MRIFISYPSKDGVEYATKLSEILTQWGHDSYYDKHLLSSEDVWGRLGEEIKQREGIIFVITPQSINSYGQKKELEVTLNFHKEHITALVETGSEIFPFLRASVYNSFGTSQDSEKLCEKLSKDLVILKDSEGWEERREDAPLDKIRYSTDGLNIAELNKNKNALQDGYLRTTIIREICSVVQRDMKPTPDEDFMMQYVKTLLPKEWFTEISDVDSSFLFSQYGRDIAIRELAYLQQQLVQKSKKRTNLETLSPDEMLERLNESGFSPDFVFIPIDYYTEIHKWQDQNGRTFVRYEPTSSTPARGSLHLNADTHPRIIFSSKHGPLHDIIMYKYKAVKWHVKRDLEFGALSIRLGNSNLYPDKVELFASTTVKCEIDPEGVLVLSLDR